MISIIVKKKPMAFDELNEGYKTNCIFKSTEDSRVDDLLDAFSKALYVDGYYETSLIMAMNRYIESYLIENELTREEFIKKYPCCSYDYEDEDCCSCCHECCDDFDDEEEYYSNTIKDIENAEEFNGEVEETIKIR